MLSIPTRRIPFSSPRSTRVRHSSSRPMVPPLIGSAPEYQRHLVIHSPRKSSTWPSHLESVSPLYKELATRWSDKSRDPRLNQLGFSLSERGGTASPTDKEWDPTRSKFETPDRVQGTDQEEYSATLYPDFLHFPTFSSSTLSSFEQTFLSLPSPPSPSTSPSTSETGTETTTTTTHIYVCTHGSRDCRCGDLGEKLYQTLSNEIQRRNLLLGDSVERQAKSREEEVVEVVDGGGKVTISRISHIGGHKFASNALVYKKRRRGGSSSSSTASCDWYGLLNDLRDVEKLLDNVVSGRGGGGGGGGEPVYENWRGRLNQTREETERLYLEHVATTSKTTKKTAKELGDRVKLKFVTFEGEELELVGYEGESLMQVAKRGDAPSILATCGGNCECATCHVHIPPILTSSASALAATNGERSTTPIPDLPTTLPEMTDEEDEQLDFAIGADDDSRLACQIPVTKELGEWVERGGRIKLPRY